MGLETKPGPGFIPPKAILFAISFKPLAIEYLFAIKIGAVANAANFLPTEFWEIKENDFTDFEKFCKMISAKLILKIKLVADSRKKKLFELIYSSKGELPVKELSEKVFWNSRQITSVENSFEEKVYPSYSITFKGRIFLSQKAYTQESYNKSLDKMEREKTQHAMRMYPRIQNRLLILVATGTLVAAVYYFIEIGKHFHWWK